MQPLVLHFLFAVQRIVLGLRVIVEIHQLQLFAFKAAGVFPSEDGDQPPFGRLVILQGVDSLPGTQEGLLHQIFRYVGIPGQPVGIPVEIAMQRMNQCFKFGLFVSHGIRDRRSGRIISTNMLLSTFFSKKQQCHRAILVRGRGGVSGNSRAPAGKSGTQYRTFHQP